MGDISKLVFEVVRGGTGYWARVRTRSNGKTRMASEVVKTKSTAYKIITDLWTDAIPIEYVDERE